MSLEILLETPFGSLDVEADSFFEFRRILFQEPALTISGLTVQGLAYQGDRLTDQPPTVIREFEAYLLDGPHSFNQEDIKELVDKFKLSETFFRYHQGNSFSSSHKILFNLVNPLFPDHVFPDISGSTFITSSYDSYNNKNGERFFMFEVYDDYTELNGSWKIKAKGDSDAFVKALECVCLAAKAVHNGTLSRFISKMNVAHGGNTR